jgi:predicted RNase H-like nuclease (RuvC/YqgF family)
MYTVQELSAMYKCTRKTMYSKLESDNIQQFIIKTDKGIRLMPEGLNTLNIIMADSKVSREQEVNNQIDTRETPNVDKYFTLYTEQLKIQSHELNIQNSYLKEQIEDLKQEKEELKREKQELQIRHDQLLTMLLDRQKLLEAPKGGFFSRVFRK